MKYSRFEILAIGVVVLAVVGTIFATVSDSNRVADIVGQLMIVVVLFGGLHYGRRGALVSFLAATCFYAIFAFGFRDEISLARALEFFLLRTGVFAVVAVVGGELNVRLKYLFVKLEHHDYVDNITNLYNSRYMAKLIDKHINEFDRYGYKFSMASFTVNPDLLRPLTKKAREKLVKDIGNSVIRGNIRGADEAARLEGTTFSVLLPNTDHDGAICASARVEGKINGYLDRQGLETEGEKAVGTEILEYPGDKDALEVMAVNLQDGLLENARNLVV